MKNLAAFFRAGDSKKKMTKIKDIVSINNRAVLNNAIQLAWYDDAAQKPENDRLVGGYVFGNTAPYRQGNHTHVSSLPIFEKIRDSFGNPQASNIFTVIAHYGHGKSHFALVLANYFGLAPDSPVVEDIVNHIEVCSDKPTADNFRNFKKVTTRPQLVVTLAGHQFQDLRQGFLQALRHALDAHDATRNHPIKSVSAKAVEWLKTLSGEKLQQADEYLGEKYQLDVDTLIAGLDNFESEKEQIVRDLSRALNGIEANFGAHVNLKQVITDTVDTLCKGADAPFHKMLILFDELGVYAQSWCHNPQSAGNLAPQEIFEACSDRPGNLCFVGFAQHELSVFVQGYNLEEEFRRWAGRMPAESTYFLVSNLEQVIGKLIVKKDKWEQFIQDNSPRITDESSMAWESIQRYKDTWDANRFYQIVSRDCYPLHPLTTGLLCGFDFTQGSRTIISAINSMLSAAEEKEANNNGRLKWIRPIELVKEFETDFKNDSPNYSDYEYALKTLSADDEPIFADILQALFLFKEGQLKKQRHEHADLLAHLAGYEKQEIREALINLTEERDAIRFSPQKREYEFTGVGTNRGEVLKIAQREVAGKRVDSLVGKLEKLREFDNLNLNDKSIASDFKTDFAVEGDEWYLASRFLDASKLNPDNTKPIKDLCLETISQGDARGTIIYLLSTNTDELEAARRKADSVFSQLKEEMKEENFTHPLIIAIPHEAATQIEKQVLIKDYLVNVMSRPKQLELGDAYRAALTKVSKDVNEQFIDHIRSVEYKTPSELHLKLGSRRRTLDEIASILFADVYKFRAPSNSVSMKPSGAKGNTATAEIARQLIVNELNFDGLNTEKQNVVRQILIEGNNKWGILDARYKIKDPKDARVTEAWNLLRTNVSETDWTSFAGLLTKLMMPPYGYDEYTATFLIAAWIGRHKHELGFKDNRRQTAVFPQTNSNQANLTLGDLQNNLNKSKEFIKWLRANVWVQHSGRANKHCAEEFLEQLQTVEDSAAGKKLLAQVPSILQTLASGNELIARIKRQEQELTERIFLAELEEKSLEEYKNTALRAADIIGILRVNESLNGFGVKNEMQSNAAFVEARSFVNKQIETIARRESQIELTRIESYDSVYGGLEKSRKALNQAGRADLEQLFVVALEKVKNDYEKLKARETEQPFITEINAIQIGGMPLRFYTDGLRRIEEILAENLSKRVSQHAHTKKNQLDEQIKNLRDFTDKLSSRVDGVRDISAAESLQSEIHRRESLYNDAPEAEAITNALEKLTARVAELKAEYRRKREEEEKERQRKQELLMAQGIAKQFAQISDSEQRFNLLTEMLQTAKNAGLSNEQKSALNNLLN